MIQIYDYVDINVSTLETMYHKRLKGYAAIGYKAKGEPQPLEESHSIFDSHSFFPVYSTDILAAQHEILIASPFLSERRVLSALDYLTTAKATVVTKPLENYAENDRAKIEECIKLLIQHGITVKTKDGLHQKFAVIDQRVIWYGNIHLLGYNVAEESIMRIESIDIVADLMEGI